MDYLNGLLFVLMVASAYPILKMKANGRLQLPLVAMLILAWAGILCWIGSR